MHYGLLTAYTSIRIEVMEKVAEVLQRQLNMVVKCQENSTTRNNGLDTALILPKIYVCGHSLGWSLVQLLALDIACNVEVGTKIPSVVKRHRYKRGVYDRTLLKRKSKHKYDHHECRLSGNHFSAR